MKIKNTKIFRLPAYTTILCQTFSSDGNYLAVGSDFGRIAIFKISVLVSEGRNCKDKPSDVHKNNTKKNSSIFHFDVGSNNVLAAREIYKPDRWSVLDLATCGGDSNSFLLASVSDKYSGRCSVVAYSWQELLIRKNAKICWSVDQSCISQMPVDINQICVDRNDAQNTGTVGKFFIAGGGPPVGQAGEAANAIKVIDIETRTELRSPLLGHENFIHSLSQCSMTGQLASASEDGTARIWDIRSKSGQIATLTPGQNPNLNRSKLGNWLGAASLSGDFLALGGGPQPALWHMRTRSPQEPYLPPDISSNSNNLGGVHVLKICEEEQKVIIGGEFGGKLYQASLSSSEIVAEIPTASGACTYSVEYQTKPLRIMMIAGSSAAMDMCSPNFSYKDRTITFPLN